MKRRDEGGQKLFLFRNLYHLMVPVYALLINVDRRSVVLTCSFSRQLEDKKHKQQNVKEMSSWEVMKTVVGMSYHEENTEAEKSPRTHMYCMWSDDPKKGMIIWFTNCSPVQLVVVSLSLIYKYIFIYIYI